MPAGSFESEPHSRGRGRAGEEAACAFLAGSGYRVLARNVVTAAGEIDVVALDGEVLCFVEVKARSDRRFGIAVASVGPRKQRRLSRAAALYLASLRGPSREVRFDVLGMERVRGGWRYQLVRGAFEAVGSFSV